jgi:hypothetical protein
MVRAEKRHILSSAFLGFVIPIICSAQAEGPVSRPDLKAGDRWTYNQIDNWKKAVDYSFERVVTEVLPTEMKTTRTRKDNQSVSHEIYKDAWTPREIEGFSGRVRYLDDYAVLTFPLQPGKKYDVQSRIENQSTGVTSVLDGKAEVIGWEDVTVPAGKFKALKIVVEGGYTRLDGNLLRGRYTSTAWYSSSVKNNVRFDHTDNDFAGRPYNKYTLELTQYNLQ